MAKWEWLNEGEPFPPGHRRAGQLGICIDFEDGRPEPQNVYASSKDEMLDKVARMYGNTQVRYAQVRKESSSPAPTTPANPAPPQRLTPEQTIQTVADLDDPAKAGRAAVDLIREETGIDLREEAAKRKAEAEAARMAGVVSQFMEANPEYHPSKRNAKLLRDRAYAIAAGQPITAEHFQQSFDELSEDGVFEAAPAESPTETPLATNTEEPLAPPPSRPRSSTGARPSQFQSRPGAVRVSGLKFTAEEVLNMAGSEEYSYRYRHEPGFAAACEAALAQA